MDLLYKPRVLAQAVAPWLALTLVVTGIGSVVFEWLVARPEIARFSNEGRAVLGTVKGPHLPDPSLANRGNVRNRSLVGVDDPELGPQVVAVYGRLPLGSIVPLLCLTPVHRCMSADEVRNRIELWPLTPLALSGAAELALAAVLGLAAHGRRRRRRAMPSQVTTDTGSA